MKISKAESSLPSRVPSYLEVADDLALEDKGGANGRRECSRLLGRKKQKSRLSW